ncbi:hypothetical protein [Bradyrhizobium sp. MOS003]|uniref:hypothetical protein n=1 Tax=Bradyrhizobium sp. MOS003 TaxID=2133946 RepID=UPI0011BD8411|nr:hypothetical protein [Bradyrhizobium sp. MOS003]
MTSQPPFGKAARRARRSSTGHGDMRPNAHRLPTGRPLIALDAAHRSIIDRATAAQLAAPVQTQSVNLPAALKSP